MKKNKFYITTPIYYVNDKPHIGHAYTTIVADVLARYYRQKLGEKNVHFLTGTDEHGAKIAESAKLFQDSDGKGGLAQITPQQFTDKISGFFKESWKKLKIENDDFIRTTEGRHKKIVVDILNKLKEAKTPQGNNVLYEADYKGLYCVGCEKFINENELVEGKCPDHDREPEKITEKNWFFKLSDFLPTIKQAIKSGELIIYPNSRKNEVLGLIDKQNIPDFSISRPVESVAWGIDLPWDDKQKVYVWVDALSNYITALDYPKGKLYKKFWPADVQLLALDILKFHTLYWPAILMALDIPLPAGLYIHGFFKIDGQKMSKSLGNVISPNELVDQYGAEITKYLILSQFSFGSESDIKINDFPTKYNADLVNGLGNLVSRTTNMVEQYLAGVIKFNDKQADWVLDNQNKIEKLKFKEALSQIWQVIGEANTLIDKHKPWELAKAGKKEELKVFLTEQMNYLYNISLALQPFMPKTTEQILKIIKAKKIKKPSKPLFPRINPADGGINQ